MSDSERPKLNLDRTPLDVSLEEGGPELIIKIEVPRQVEADFLAQCERLKEISLRRGIPCEDEHPVALVGPVLHGMLEWYCDWAEKELDKQGK